MPHAFAKSSSEQVELVPCSMPKRKGTAEGQVVQSSYDSTRSVSCVIALRVAVDSWSWHKDHAFRSMRSTRRQ